MLQGEASEQVPAQPPEHGTGLPVPQGKLPGHRLAAGVKYHWRCIRFCLRTRKGEVTALEHQLGHHALAQTARLPDIPRGVGLSPALGPALKPLCTPAIRGDVVHETQAIVTATELRLIQ